MTNYEKAEQAMKTLMECSNSMGSNDDIAQAISNVLLKEHRTIQQSFFRSFKQSMDAYSKGGSDGRNEGAIQLAKEIHNSDVFLPFV